MWEFVLKYWVEFAFGLVAAGLVAAYRKMAVKIQNNKETEKAIADGMKYLLMFKLREEGEKYLTDGHCNIDQKHEFEKVYTAYHALGGNDTITALKDKVLQLPI
jgi:hypothetical protein